MSSEEDIEEVQNKMTEIKFKPPLNVEEVLSINKGPEELINRISLLLSDLNGKLFALQVVVDTLYNAAIREFQTEEPFEFPEPVFVVPNPITKDLIKKLIEASDPSTLDSFLVPQVD